MKSQMKSQMKSKDDWVDEPVKAPKPKKKVKQHAKLLEKTKAKTQAKTKKKVIDPNKKITVNFKIDPKEARAIKLKAKSLTRGNVTQMVRLAILAWKPAKNSLEGIRKTTRP